MGMTRRDFLVWIEQAGGYGAAFTTVQSLGLMPLPQAEAVAWDPSPELGKGIRVVILGGGIAGLAARDCGDDDIERRLDKRSVRNGSVLFAGYCSSDTSVRRSIGCVTSSPEYLSGIPMTHNRSVSMRWTAPRRRHGNSSVWPMLKSHFRHGLFPCQSISSGTMWERSSSPQAFSRTRPRFSLGSGLCHI
jgi:hypothetical protein